MVERGNLREGKSEAKYDLILTYARLGKDSFFTFHDNMSHFAHGRGGRVCGCEELGEEEDEIFDCSPSVGSAGGPKI